MDVNVFYGEKQLLFSGSFITFGLGETRVILTDGKEHLTLVFNFIMESLASNSRKRVTILDPTTLELTLTNYTGARYAIKEPLSIGSLSGREIFLLYSISAPAKSNSKTVTYSVYAGREVTEA